MELNLRYSTNYNGWELESLPAEWKEKGFSHSTMAELLAPMFEQLAEYSNQFCDEDGEFEYGKFEYDPEMMANIKRIVDAHTNYVDSIVIHYDTQSS